MYLQYRKFIFVPAFDGQQSFKASYGSCELCL